MLRAALAATKRILYHALSQKVKYYDCVVVRAAHNLKIIELESKYAARVFLVKERKL